MAQSKKVLISISEEMLTEMDARAEKQEISRSELVRTALKLYLSDQHKMEIREQMRKGYEEMSAINHEWAEFGLGRDMQILDAYEAILSERE